MHNWVVFWNEYRPCPLVSVSFWRMNPCFVYFCSPWYFAHSMYINTVVWIYKWINKWVNVIGIICILPLNCLRLLTSCLQLLVSCLQAASKSIISSTFNVTKSAHELMLLYLHLIQESLNIIESGTNLTLEHQPASWDHSPPLPGKGFCLSSLLCLSKALWLLSHILRGR